MNEKYWTNIYIVGMYLLKNESTMIRDIKYKRTGTFIEYYHEDYGVRVVSITSTTNLERTFFAIDYDGDDDFEYVMCNKKESY